MSRLGRRQLHELYYYLKLTRRTEEEIARLHREGMVGGPVSLSVGLEALTVGTAYQLGQSDFIASSLPSVGCFLVRGVPPDEIFAHFMGKDSGLSKGRDGSIYMGDLGRGLVSPDGHLAAHLGVSAGIALAAKLAGTPLAALALVGKKAVSTGDFHEGLNFAAVHQLPLVVVVDHDHGAPGISSSQYLYERTRGYSVPSLPVDGVDILQIIQVVETAVERARAGKGPTLIEVRTVHGGVHELGDGSLPFPFETPVRLDGAKNSEESTSASAPPTGRESIDDPVVNLETFLVDHGLLKPVERGLILDGIERLIKEGLQLAAEGPFPDKATLSEGVYAVRSVVEEQSTSDGGGA